MDAHGKEGIVEISRYRRCSRRQAIRAGLAVLGGLGAGIGMGMGNDLAGPHGRRMMARADAAGAGPRGQVPDKLVTATRAFGIRLLHELTARQPSQNVFISPSSVATALATTYNGAAGTTRQAMATTLGLQGMSMPEVDAAHARLAATLQGLDPKVELTIANSLWSRRGVTLNPAFVTAAQRYYGAKATTLDFGDPRAAATINDWVAAETHGRITHIVPAHLPADSILYLVNALYFKGRWAVPFDKAQTAERPFTLPGGGHAAVPMMTQTSSFPYYQGSGFQGISLPYGNGKWSMYVLLPDKESSLAALQRNLTADAWESWLSRFSTSYGRITLPRFSMGYSHNLNAALSAMGMAEAFGRSADFGNLTPDTRARISAVAHATRLDVDEAGTTASAATSVGIVATAVRMPAFTMTVDRPFVCAISDSATGTLLFVGAIVNPSS